MSKISVELLLATRGSERSNNGLATFVVEVPYYVWVELLTHKRLARNASSARAQKTERHISMGYYVPDFFYRKGDGMTSSDLVIENQERAREIYSEVWEFCTNKARELDQLGVAKEQSNRILPSNKMIKGLLTATEDAWYRFLVLRDNHSADKAMQEVARMIRTSLENNKWNINENHIPLGDADSTFLEVGARLARISYGNPQKGKTDLELGKDLYKNGHYSPFEHIAFWKIDPCPSVLCSKPEDLYNGWGWYNYRSYLERNEGIT